MSRDPHRQSSPDVDPLHNTGADGSRKYLVLGAGLQRLLAG